MLSLIGEYTEIKEIVAVAKKPSSHEHNGHRQRMKQRALTDGIATMSPHEVIEILLYFAIPQRDTNPLAHRLINAFSSVNRVLSAEYADLIKIEGVTPHIASLLTFSGELARRYMREQFEPGKQICTVPEFVEHLLPWFVGEKEESVVMISMDNRCKVLNTTRLFSGSVNASRFNARAAVQQALQDNATVVILAHNHPNGYAFPSEADVRTTIEMIEIFAAMNIRVLDHIIVSDDDAVSMASSHPHTELFDLRVPLLKMRTLSEWCSDQVYSITGAQFFQVNKSEETR